MLITNYGFGGAEKAFADHSKLLAGYAEVQEFVFNDFSGKRVYDSGNPYQSLDVKGGGGIIGSVVHFWQRIQRFRRLKKRFDPDITISFMEGADYINMLSGGKDRKVIVVQGSKVGDLNISGTIGRLRHNMLMPWFYKKADRIICVSEDIRKEMTDVYGIAPQKIAVAHNFYDEENLLQRLSATVPEDFVPLFQPHKFRLITFARLAAQKNLDALFPVYKQLKAAGQPVSLFILGDGELREMLISKAREAGAVATVWDAAPMDKESDIFFLGFQPNPMAFLKYAHLYLMPSLWEGSPLALCEAMASGIAVLSADCPTGPREIIDEEKGGQSFGILKNGGLLPMITRQKDPDVVQLWSETIVKLIKDPALLTGIKENGSERVKHFSKSTLGPVWVREYMGACAGT